MQETEHLIKETSKEVKETAREVRKTAKQLKETDKLVGKLSNRFGELAEHLVVPNIKEKFKTRGFTFEEISPNKRIEDAFGNRIVEIDILLENSDTVMVVEVKAKPGEKDVDEHIDRMNLLRRRADARQDKRKFYGSIAGAIINNEVRNYILKSGFYVIEQTGDTVKINTPKGFKPREW